MSTTSSAPFSFRIDNQLKQQVDELCELTERSKAYVATKALEEYVSRHKWKAEAIKKAKAEAQKGEFISQDAMMQWANALGTDNELPAPEVDTFVHMPWYNLTVTEYA